jgi:hypothetical protein
MNVGDSTKGFVKDVIDSSNERKKAIVDMLKEFAAGDTAKAKREVVKDLVEQKDLPLGCFVDFDLEVVDIFEEMIRAKVKVSDKVKELYAECKSLLGHVPSRMDFFEYLDDLTYKSIKVKNDFMINPFKNYLAYMNVMEEAYVTDEFINSDVHRFVRLIETTSMNKLYKIPVLRSFLQDDELKTEASRSEITKNFHRFYQNERHYPDIAKDKASKGFREWTPDKYWKVALANPIHFLCKSSKEFFSFEDDVLYLALEFSGFEKDEFSIKQVKDAIEYRRAEFVDQRL